MFFSITVEELKGELSVEAKNLVILDVRYQLNDPNAGKKAYLKGHIPGAIYLDLKEDLSGKAGIHGGSHPLPDREAFSSKLGELGINQDTEVVIYGDTNDMNSARCFWMLEHIGHEKARILEGGWEEWVQKGSEITTDIPNYKSKTFILGEPKDDIVDINDVKEKTKHKSAVLIDSRAHERYLGNTEPLYKRAGHIPGAINFFWKDVLNADENWKSPEELEEHFKDLAKDEGIIVSCGSGVSACPNVLALKQIGFKNVKLYPGSFSDWISYVENPLETGEK